MLQNLKVVQVVLKRGSGWVILNNKKGGVWRKCDSKKHCEILNLFQYACR